jgi:hypothetical protein
MKTPVTSARRACLDDGALGRRAAVLAARVQRRRLVGLRASGVHWRQRVGGDQRVLRRRHAAAARRPLPRPAQRRHAEARRRCRRSVLLEANCRHLSRRPGAASFTITLICWDMLPDWFSCGTVTGANRGDQDTAIDHC